MSANALQISFAAQLWSVFRAVIAGALDELKTLLGDAVTLIMETIESHVQRFCVQALQLDPELCDWRPSNSRFHAKFPGGNEPRNISISIPLWSSILPVTSLTLPFGCLDSALCLVFVHDGLLIMSEHDPSVE